MLHLTLFPYLLSTLLARYLMEGGQNDCQQYRQRALREKAPSCCGYPSYHWSSSCHQHYYLSIWVTYKLFLKVAQISQCCVLYLHITFVGEIHQTVSITLKKTETFSHSLHWHSPSPRLELPAPVRTTFCCFQRGICKPGYLCKSTFLGGKQQKQKTFIKNTMTSLHTFNF